MTKTHEEQAKRWREHFEIILSCPEPTIQFKVSHAVYEVEELEIDIEAIRGTDKKVNQKSKNGKAKGNDGIRAELTKYGSETVVRS